MDHRLRWIALTQSLGLFYNVKCVLEHYDIRLR